ncbi:threonine/serine exporter family protein [Rothia aerolata]|uniref:Threonine/serine exporter-like N-terminal domain-containing protein n=1 Tax=Rothia aerolata TaxID=1812262 RepID=A0A917IRZ1_9MICC|nr:threonine/serine exporter family protein [Rothia aerolata]GGH61628.1 hypothetical protein GCM10007359_10990 [Rothia aerolata]
MEKNEQGLSQSAYPSASAFEQTAQYQQVPSAEDDPQPFGAQSTGGLPVGAFGAPGTLPRTSPAQAAPAAAASSSEPTKPLEKTSLPHPNALPVVSAEGAFGPVAEDPFSPAEPKEEDLAPLTTTVTPISVAETPSTTDGMQQAAYPSVAPQTSGIPKVAYKRKLGAGQAVRSSIKSFMQPNQSLTVPIRGVARVAQRQFTMAAKVNRERFVQKQEEARAVLNFTVRLAETMFHYGADTMDVDSAIVAVCSTYGLDDVEVDVTSQSVLINYVSDISVDEENKQLFSSFGARTSERFTHTVVRVVRSNSENYSSLEAIYRLIHAITEKGLDRKAAERRLHEINTRPKLFSPAGILGFNLLMAVAFTFGVGGSWRAAILSFFVFIAVHFAMQWVGRLKLPSFFTMAVGSGVITSAAMYVTHEASVTEALNFYVSGPHVVAAGLMMLLPTARLVSASQDALTGYPLTSAGKFVTTGVSFIGLVVGIALALTVMSFFDAVSMDIRQAVFNPPPLWVSVAGMALGSVAVVAAAQGTWKNMFWVLVVSLSGQAVYYGMSALVDQEPGKLNVALGAFVVGSVSAVLAFRLHSPQSIFAVPGIMFLLPGLTIFRGLYSVVIDPDPLAGIANILDASATILTLSAGVILGIYITQNIIQRIIERRHPEDQHHAPTGSFEAPINR